MGKLKFKLFHVMPHVWFYKQKEILGRSDSNDPSEPAIVYRRSTSMRLVKSGSSSTQASAVSHKAVAASPRKDSSTRPVKLPEKSRKGRDNIQVCTVVDAGCSCRATVTSHHKEKGKSTRAGSATIGSGLVQSGGGVPSSMVSRLACKSTADVVRASKNEGDAMQRTREGKASDAQVKTVKESTVGLDVCELAYRLKSVGWEAEKKSKKQHPQGSPECLARVTSPAHSGSPQEISPNYVSTHDCEMGIDQNSWARFSDESSSFCKMSSSVSSCRPSTSELDNEGIASCEEMRLYSSEGTLGATFPQRRGKEFHHRPRTYGRDRSKACRNGDLGDDIMPDSSNMGADSKEPNVRKDDAVANAPILLGNNSHSDTEEEMELESDCDHVGCSESASLGDNLRVRDDQELVQETISTSKIQVVHHPSKVCMQQPASHVVQSATLREGVGQVLKLLTCERPNDTTLEEHTSSRSRKGRQAKPKAFSDTDQPAEIRNISDDNTASDVFNSVAMVKSSYDPQQDFKESMVEMVLAKQLNTSEDLQQLLECYLSLNSEEYHDIIVQVFHEVWSDLFRRSYTAAS